MAILHRFYCIWFWRRCHLKISRWLPYLISERTVISKRTIISILSLDVAWMPPLEYFKMTAIFNVRKKYYINSKPPCCSDAFHLKISRWLQYLIPERTIISILSPHIARMPPTGKIQDDCHIKNHYINSKSPCRSNASHKVSVQSNT